MGAEMRINAVIVYLFSILVMQNAYAQNEISGYSRSMTQEYSQQTLLKNWAFSVCLASVSKNQEAIDDANATASAYLEFGKQPIEAYQALKKLSEQYAKRQYAGSIKSEFNTMKCIDLFHSKELDILVNELTRAHAR